VAVLASILRAFINYLLPCSYHPGYLPLSLGTLQNNGRYKKVKTCYWAFSVASDVMLLNGSSCISGGIDKRGL
jgi:hypothetical protein